MKNFISVFILTAAFFISAFSAGYKYAEVKVSGTEDIKFLQQNNIDIDRTSFGKNGSLTDGKITVYVTEDQYEFLEKTGYGLKWTPLEVRDKLSYRNNTSIGDSMLIWQNRYPSICKRLQIGTSAQGRPMWALKITDNVDIEEAEPEVKFISTIHGDEVTGMEMEMFMIENILKGYEANNDTMRFIVDNTELYVMPLMNPDGNANNSRYNAYGYDLNRNFPEGTAYDLDSVNVTALPEIAAMINWTKEHNFIMSTNFHGGALVANYLYDIDFGVSNFSYAACPDDPHVSWLAYNYSVRNSPMYNGPFTEGITNGSEWYQITGGMQDWNYRYHNCLDITLEISNTKWPSYTYIPGFWRDNREAMFWYLSAAHKGIYGIVTDADTGEPLAASIEIEGIDKIYYTDPDHGDYYRILKPGTFNVTVASEDHYQQTFYGIEVTDNTGKFKEATELNIQLLSCVGIHENSALPDGIVLHQNYPNPFNPSTMISFTTDSDQYLRLCVFDSTGELVEKIAERNFTKGTHTFDFNAERLSSGAYYYSVSGSNGSEITKKMLMLK